MNNNSNLDNTIESQEQEIDFIKIALKIWDKRKFILKICGIAAIVGLIIAFSVVKKFTTSVIAAPELQHKSGLQNNFQDLANVLGIDLSSGDITVNEGLAPMIYPFIIQSTPFIIDLLEIPVTTKNGKISTTYADYLMNYQKKEWWSYIISAPKSFIHLVSNLFTKKDEDKTTVDTFHLTKQQFQLIENIKSNINLSVSAKEGFLKLNIKDQDPVVSATVATEVMKKLYIYIAKYRTSKAEADCNFYKNLCSETREDYYKAQREYAVYSDENQNVVLASSKIEQERLYNQMQLAFELYNHTSQQYQLAQMKVQESKPVYTIIQPATIPQIGTPGRLLVLIAFIIVAGFGAIGWIFFKGWYLNLKEKICGDK